MYPHECESKTQPNKTFQSHLLHTRRSLVIPIKCFEPIEDSLVDVVTERCPPKLDSNCSRACTNRQLRFEK